MKLINKVALITGAGSGMGRATALLFSREGAKVAVVDIDEKGGQETMKMVKEKGGEAIFIKAAAAARLEVTPISGRQIQDTVARVLATPAHLAARAKSIIAE